MIRIVIEIDSPVVNRQQLTKHIREELLFSTKLHMPETWQRECFDDMKVFPLTDIQNQAVSKALKSAFSEAQDDNKQTSSN